MITVGVCLACKHYPWVRDADPSLLPVQKCHPSLPARRWTAATVRARNDCPFFAPADEDAKALPGAEVEPVEAAEAEPETRPDEALEMEGDASEEAADVEGVSAEDEEAAEEEAAHEPAEDGARVWNVPEKPKVRNRRGGKQA